MSAYLEQTDDKLHAFGQVFEKLAIVAQPAKNGVHMLVTVSGTGMAASAATSIDVEAEMPSG